MTQQMESEGDISRNDALSIGVLMRLMSSQTSTAPPALPLYRVRDVAEAYQLAAIAYDTRRIRQLVVMSPGRHGWQLDPVEVMLHVGDDADVVILDNSKTIRDVAEALTRELTPFSGDVRILRPGLSEPNGTPEHGVNPIVRPGRDGSPKDALALIGRKVQDGKNLHRAIPGTLSEEDVAAAVDAAVRAERARTADAASELASLRRTVRAQRQQDGEERRVYADPHAQFRYELHRAWLMATEEGDRQKWRLREWELGETFLDSIEEQQIVERPQVIRACVDVITGRYREINSRASHRLRSSTGGNAPAVEGKDGEAAWRCSVNTGPAAARLMWWECPGDLVKLSVVRTHDDLRIV